MHEMTYARQNGASIPQFIGELNRNLKGWGSYFHFTGGADIDVYVCDPARRVATRYLSESNDQVPQGRKFNPHMTPPVGAVRSSMR